jgi:MFS superfamily sulfate permease-like transporter
MIKTDSILKDLKSGFFISLIALPLCLGIAIASSFPPIAGVITAIVGGLVVSLIGGCSLSIKGPAAGLIVIVLASVMDLGAGDMALGYRRTLAVGVIAAILQILFALFKTARFGRIMPPSVIHGMLAAIGVIIVSKQIHILVGTKPHGKSTIELITEIPSSIMSLNPELAFIGIFTLIMMVIIPFIPSRLIKSVPPALIALLVVVPLSLFWHLDNPHTYNFLSHDFQVGPAFLVNIPANLLSSFVMPDFSILGSAIAYKYVLMLALVGSVESVLTVIAIDSITKTKEKSNLDRDLLGVGIGNLICSLIGGLPMISEVVRSKANIDSGAKSNLSNFFHGAFLLLAVSLLAPIIREIPLAALAAMLIITGFRLAAPAQFKKTYNIGADQLALFVTTLLVTLATDLLVGILVGIVLKLAIHFYRGVKLNQMFKAPISMRQNGKTMVLTIEGPAVFSNYFSLQKQLMQALPMAEKIEIDFSKASLIDHTTLSCLQDVRDQLGHQKLSIIGLNNHIRTSEHQLSTHRFA